MNFCLLVDGGPLAFRFFKFTVSFSRVSFGFLLCLQRDFEELQKD